MAVPTKTVAPDIRRLPLKERLRLTILATIPKVPSAIGAQLRQLLDPEMLAVAAGVLVIWAGLQFTGAGEVADVAILVVGWIALGGAAWQAARELIAFAVGVDRAKSPSGIDLAAQHLAAAISLIGVQAVLMMLLHTAPKPYRSPPNVPEKYWKGRWPLGAPPIGPPGKWAYEPTAKIVPSAEMRPNVMGTTSVWGDIRISSALSADDARATLLHEQVHSFLSPKLYLLRNLRAQIKLQGYGRSVLLRYIEEAMCETYAMLRTRGLDMNALVDSIKFPISSGGYTITLARMTSEAAGSLFGPVNVSGMIWNVSLSQGDR